MKTCTRCERELPQCEFAPGRPGKTRPRCRACHDVAVRACAHCGVAFEGKSGRRFCSPACRSTSRPPTYKTCPVCALVFGPVDRLDRKFCGWACTVRARPTGRRVIRRTHTRARSAQSLLRYHVQAGNIARPDACERCGATGQQIEGAHCDYDQPLQVEWLCVPCHRRWDASEPKGATYRVPVGPESTVEPGYPPSSGA
jgi:hypothetical protein